MSIVCGVLVEVFGLELKYIWDCIVLGLGFCGAVTVFGLCEERMLGLEV